MRVHPAVRRLCPEDAASLIALRREALENHPLAFAASIEDDRGLSPEFVRTVLADHEQAVFGHVAGARLTGMVGVLRGAGVKRRHKAHVWGMYVAPLARQQGVGRALLDATIAQARAWPGVSQIHLSVSDTAVAARRLYEAAGFRSWGRERRALQWEGQFVDEFHLVLDLIAESLPSL
jgi:ribosomal protein S18 acetylase RimI-like enzyme